MRHTTRISAPLFAAALYGAPTLAACPASMPDTAFRGCIANELTGLASAVVDTRETLALQETTIADLEATVASQAAYIEALESYLSVDTATHDVVFSGANVHIQSGSGATNGTVNGLGNLVLGYNESEGGEDRSGSHNLVLGYWNGYSDYSGIVGGFRNDSIAPMASVIGGSQNIASGNTAVVISGFQNTAYGLRAAIVAGWDNTAPGDHAAVVSGYQNNAGGNRSAVLAGEANSAEGEYSAVTGGNGNTAAADHEVAP